MILSNQEYLNDDKVDFDQNIELKILILIIQKENLFINLNLNISKDSKVGIIGETGTGKSTIIDLITGFKKPINGSVLVDRKKVENIKNWIKIFLMCHKNFYLIVLLEIIFVLKMIKKM